MKITVEKNEIQAALGKIVGAVDRASTMPILSTVLIEGQPLYNSISLRTSDLEIFASSVCAAQGDMKAEGFCLPAAKLKAAIDACPDDQVIIDGPDEASVVITSGTARFQLASLSSDEYPSPPETVSVNCVLPPRLIDSIVKAVGHAVSKNEQKWNLCGIHLTSENAGRLTAVAADGHRLSLAAVDHDDAEQFSGGITLPAKSARLVSGLAGALEYSLSEKGSIVHFQNGVDQISARQIEEAFPDYRRVVPQNHQKHIMVDSDATIQALEACGVVTEGKSRSVTLKSEGDVLTLSALGTEGKVSVTVPCDGTDNIEITLNAAYLIPALKSLGGEVFLKFEDKSKPLLAIPVDHHGWDERLEVLMPLRMD